MQGLWMLIILLPISFYVNQQLMLYYLHSLISCCIVSPKVNNLSYVFFGAIFPTCGLKNAG